MMQRRLRVEEVELLREVLVAQAPTHLDELLGKAAGGTLMHAERAYLCELIGAEFATTGVAADFEPMQRGIRLEDLLDALNSSKAMP